MTTVLVPAKALAHAKSRLTGWLPGPARRELARYMLRRVLTVARGAPGVEAVWVITHCHEVAGLAQQQGAGVLYDPPYGLKAGLSPLPAIIDYGLDALRTRGAQALLVLMADLPHICSDDIQALLAELGPFDAVLAPNHSGHGTNALALAPGCHGPFATGFGRPDSLLHHQRWLQRLRWSVTTVQRPGLAFDLDTGQDMLRYEALMTGNPRRDSCW